MQGPVGPLSRGIGEEAKVPDGLRYHMLDIWVEELRPVLKEGDEEVGQLLMAPIRTLEREGKVRTMRKRAKETIMEWDKKPQSPSNQLHETDGENAIGKNQLAEESEGEWNGFAD